MMDNGMGNGSGSDNDPFQEEEDEKKLVSFIDGKLDEVRNSDNRTSHESIWLTNTAWLLGYVNVYWDASLKSFRNVDIIGTARQRLQTNRILPAIHNRTARLTKNPPKYEVRPNSMSPEDKDACRLGKMVIDHIWDVQKINRKRIDLTMWKQQCGHAYMKVCWDTELGEPMQDPETGEIQKTGDIRVDVVPALEVYVDPNAKSIEDATWLIQAKIRPLSYFKSHYPGVGDLVKEEKPTLIGLQYEQRIATMNAKSDGVSQTVKNSAVEKVYYEAPTKKRPNGRMVVTGGGKKLEDKELPCGEIPFSKFDDIIIGGKFNSEAIITQVRPIQEQVNRIVNQRNAWIKQILAGKYTVARGAGIAQEAMDDQSGELVEYDPVPNTPDGGRPEALQIPMIPQYAYTEEDRLVSAINDIMGNSEISQGKLPAAGIPAIGMQILLEADDTRIGLVAMADEISYAKVGQLILKYAQKYYTEPRLLKVSSNQGYLVKSFIGADLKNNHDVIVVRGSTIPNSTVVKRQDILNLFNQGLLGDPSDPAVRERVLGWLEFGELSEVWKKRGLDEMQVKQALEHLEQGLFDIVVSEFDNHAYWLQEFNNYRLTGAEGKYGKLMPAAKIEFDKIMNDCLRFLMPSGLQNPAAPIAEEPVASPEGSNFVPPEEMSV